MCVCRECFVAALGCVFGYKRLVPEDLLKKRKRKQLRRFLLSTLLESKRPI